MYNNHRKPIATSSNNKYKLYIYTNTCCSGNSARAVQLPRGFDESLHSDSNREIRNVRFPTDASKSFVVRFSLLRSETRQRSDIIRLASRSQYRVFDVRNNRWSFSLRMYQRRYMKRDYGSSWKSRGMYKYVFYRDVFPFVNQVWCTIKYKILLGSSKLKSASPGGYAYWRVFGFRPIQ